MHAVVETKSPQLYSAIVYDSCVTSRCFRDLGGKAPTKRAVNYELLASIWKTLTFL